MYTTYPDRQGVSSLDRRQNGRLRAIYDEATGLVRHLFHSHADWVGTSIDFIALRLVHEHYPELTPHEVRALVASIGGRLQHCVGQGRLTALYP